MLSSDGTGWTNSGQSLFWTSPEPFTTEGTGWTNSRQSLFWTSPEPFTTEETGWTNSRRVYSEHLLSPPLRMGLAETAFNSLLRYTGGLESRPIEHLFWNTFFKWDCWNSTQWFTGVSGGLKRREQSLFSNTLQTGLPESAQNSFLIFLIFLFLEQWHRMWLAKTIQRRHTEHCLF